MLQARFPFKCLDQVGFCLLVEGQKMLFMRGFGNSSIVAVVEITSISQKLQNCQVRVMNVLEKGIEGSPVVGDHLVALPSELMIF